MIDSESIVILSSKELGSKKKEISTSQKENDEFFANVFKSVDGAIERLKKESLEFVKERDKKIAERKKKEAIQKEDEELSSNIDSGGLSEEDINAITAKPQIKKNIILGKSRRK